MNSELRQETDELIGIFTASVKTAKRTVSLPLIIYHPSFIILTCPTNSHL
jgi:hypothetical protein